MSQQRKTNFLRTEINGLKVSTSVAAFGRGCAVITPDGHEVALMARDDKTLAEMFERLVPGEKIDLSKAHNVAMLQADHVSLEDDEL